MSQMQFPIKIGEETRVKAYASTLVKGEEQLLVTRDGKFFITDGKGGYKTFRSNDIYTIEEIDKMLLESGTSVDGLGKYVNEKLSEIGLYIESMMNLINSNKDSFDVFKDVTEQGILLIEEDVFNISNSMFILTDELNRLTHRYSSDSINLQQYLVSLVESCESAHDTLSDSILNVKEIFWRELSEIEFDINEIGKVITELGESVTSNLQSIRGIEENIIKISEVVDFNHKELKSTAESLEKRISDSIIDINKALIDIKRSVYTKKEIDLKFQNATPSAEKIKINITVDGQVIALGLQEAINLIVNNSPISTKAVAGTFKAGTRKCGSINTPVGANMCGSFKVGTRII